MRFIDRADAGSQLAHELEKYKDENPVIIGIPRGGTILAHEIQKKIGGEIDIMLVKKITDPLDPEYAIGALSETGAQLLGTSSDSLSEELLNKQIDEVRLELQRRKKVYMGSTPHIDLTDRVVILVDDGIATGLTFTLALREIRKQSPKKIIVAVPVSPTVEAHRIESLADEFVVLHTPLLFLGSIGAYYKNFAQVSDEEVIEVLKQNTN